MFIEIKENLINLDDVSWIEKHEVSTKAVPGWIGIKYVNIPTQYRLVITLKSRDMKVIHYREDGELATNHYNKIKNKIFNKSCTEK